MTNHRARLLLVVVSIGAAALAAGCASAPQEVDLPPQTLTEAPTSTAEQEANLVSSSPQPPVTTAEDLIAEALSDEPHAELAEEAAADAATADPSGLSARRHTIVIQPSATAQPVTAQTLQQALASERERRAAAEAPVAVITNRNLAQLAEGGQLTVLGQPSTAPTSAAVTAPAGAGATSGAPAPVGSSDAKSPAAATAALNEEYWRSQALKIRLDWKEAVEAVDELSAEVEDLRRRFYAEDDPFYRDNQIKPSWDRALDQLSAAKADAEEQERKLSRFLDEGRRSGALPGWLREGTEFEPPATPDHTQQGRRRADDPWEPKVLEEEEPRDR